MAKIRPFYPLFTWQSKSGRLIFGENWPKYQAYSLTFWPKLANFTHFLLDNPNQADWFLVKIGQNTKPIALLFGQNSPILPTFHSTIQIRQIDFWWKLAKIPSLEPYFLAKIAPFYPLFTPQSKSGRLIFGENWPKYQAYGVTFTKIATNFTRTNFEQKGKPISLLFDEKSTFSLLFVSSKSGPNFTLAYFQQKGKPIALFFDEEITIFRNFSWFFTGLSRLHVCYGLRYFFCRKALYFY